MYKIFLIFLVQISEDDAWEFEEITLERVNARNHSVKFRLQTKLVKIMIM